MPFKAKIRRIIADIAGWVLDKVYGSDRSMRMIEIAEVEND